MSPSSMFVIARHFGARSITLPGRPDVVDARSSLQAFHSALARGLDALREQMTAWRDEGLRVAVYGGGMHTRALFELAGLDLAAIAAVIDDDLKKAGTAIAGIPVIPLSEALAAAPDIILISTLASEDALLERLPGKVPAGIRIFGIYRHFFK